MPPRKSRLSQGKPLERKTPMLRGDDFKTRANPPKRKTSGQAKTNRGLDALKRQARARDMDSCVRCGLVLAGAGNVHHRRNRGMGGSQAANTVSNLITLCGSPIVGCHGLATQKPWEIDAERYGWVLSTNGSSDPATVPVLVAWLGWALPAADGSWQVLDQRAVA
ncbi:HNH endonuclease signature motif containing protein [Nonomuraea sp. NPDC046802]|uniref:HNH endonuclease n=1 Tax=Nonomuraea sp. NPDC046802 TaxID=3154919 RepID=UPI0033FD1BE8